MTAPRDHKGAESDLGGTTLVDPPHACFREGSTSARRQAARNDDVWPATLEREYLAYLAQPPRPDPHDLYTDSVHHKVDPRVAAASPNSDGTGQHGANRIVDATSGEVA
jgi:hypothetical protein